MKTGTPALQPYDLSTGTPPPARLGLYAHHLKQGTTIAFQADQTFPAASTIKIPILMAVFRSAQRRKLSWEECLTVQARDQIDPESPLNREAPGSSFPVRDLVQRMITVSDNIATNLLIERLGRDAINAYMKELGLQQTALRRRMADMAARERGEDNTTTAREMASLLELMARRAVKGWRSMLGILRSQQDREKIPDHLPPDLTIANKPGELPGLRADVALVEAPAGPLVLSIFLDGLPDDQAGDALIGRIARTIYRQFEPEAITTDERIAARSSRDTAPTEMA